jgi:hypothetical protein
LKKNCVESKLIQRWPLHPQPYGYETLDGYIRRLADCYGVKYKYFLQRALGMSLSELMEYQSSVLPPKALQLLSNGTGCNRKRLKLMTIGNNIKRALKEIQKTMTPEEIKELSERFSKKF